MAQTPEATTKDLPAMRLAAIPHIGAYMGIGAAFQRLFQTAGPAGLFGPGMLMLGVYHDDPRKVAQDKLRSHAALSIAEGRPIPAGFEEVRTAAGRYGVITHKGPYDGLPATWKWIHDVWMPKHCADRMDAPALEIYRNNPMNTKPQDLVTEICVPVKG